AYVMFLIHWQSRTPRESLITLVATGVVIGLAIGAKWIALAALGSMVFLLLMRAVVRSVDVQYEGPSGIWRWGRSLFTGTVVPGGASGWVYTNLLAVRSEEHTSELQSQSNLVCRLLLEKKNK